MSLRSVRQVGYPAAALVILSSMAAVAADQGAPTVAPEDDRVVVTHREARFSPVWPQPVASATTLVSRKDAERKVRVESPRGGRVWTASDLADHDVPAAALTAYKNAAHRMSVTDPACQLPWTLLAAIGRVESNHGRFAGSVLSTDGVARPEIIGIALNGAGPVAAISDSDGGELDGDTTWDRAVGPMQFIPTTWAWAGRDGDGNGVENPHDIDDAALAAADYLCSGGSVATGAGMKAAIFRYNPSDDYVRLVRAFEKGYSTGVFEVPSPEPGNDQKKDKQKHKKKDGKKGAKNDGKKGKDERDDDGGKGGKGGPTKPSPSPTPGTKPGTKPKPRPSSPSPAPQPGQASPQQPGQPGPAQQDPTPSNPAPDNPSPGSPSPGSPSPSDPSPGNPDPSPSPPTPREETGVLERCGTDWCLGGTRLDFGTGVPASLDLNGDATSGTLDEELTAMAGPGVTMTVLGTGPYTVVKVGNVTFG